MAAQIIGAVAFGGLSGWLSGRSAKDKAERERASLSARIGLLKKQKEFKKKAFELETFNRFIEKERVGANRINQALNLGSMSSSMSALKSLDNMIYQKDVAEREFGFGYELSIRDDQIRDLEGNLASIDPQKDFWKSFAVSAISGGATGYSLGGAIGGGGATKPK